MKNLENDKRRNAYFALESTWTFLSVDHKWFFYIFQMMLLLIYFLKKFDAFHLLYFTLKMARSTWGKEICIVFVFYSCVKLNFCCIGGGLRTYFTYFTLGNSKQNKACLWQTQQNFVTHLGHFKAYNQDPDPKKFHMKFLIAILEIPRCL